SHRLYARHIAAASFGSCTAPEKSPMLGYRNAASMPSRSRSLMRAWGSKPPGRPSLYIIVSASTDPSRAPTAPSRPSPFGLPRIFPSTSKRSLPLSPMIRRGARSRYAGSMYRSQRSRGSRMWPSASMTLYVRAMARLRRDGWFLLRRGGSPCQAPRGGRPLGPRGGAIPAPAGSPPSLCPKPCRGRHSEKADFCPTPEHVDGCPKGDRLRQPRHEGRVASRVRNPGGIRRRSEEHTSELQSRGHLVCRLLLDKKHK